MIYGATKAGIIQQCAKNLKTSCKSTVLVRWIVDEDFVRGLAVETPDYQHATFVARSRVGISLRHYLMGEIHRLFATPLISFSR